MEKTVGAFEARRNLGKLIEEAFYKKDSFIIERSGRPMAVLVSIEDYQKWQRLAKETVFSMIEAVQKRNEKVPPLEMERDIRNALKSLRQEQHARGKSKA